MHLLSLDTTHLTICIQRIQRIQRKTRLISMEDRQTNNLLSRGLARLSAKISRCSEDTIYGFRDPVFLNVYGVQD